MFAHGRLTMLLKDLTRTRRRGTILLLVLGALAMVLILTVVYASLGKGDRTTGRAVNQQRGATEVIERFGEHVVGVIGGDPVDLVPDMAEQRLLDLDPSLEARYRTETTDAPVSDFSMLSVPSEAAGGTIPAADAPLWSLRQFRPTGGHSSLVPWPEDTTIFERQYDTDPRIAADPWLASLRPTDFGVGSKPASLLGGGNYDEIPFYARALDWMQISNLAPDGRFVNLAFLRDDFDAPSLDLTRDPDTREPRLALFGVDGLAKIAEDNADFVLGMAGVQDYAGIDIDGGGAATPDWNVPAHWTMYQRNMARTVAELSREGFNSNNPSDPRYWEYSYADADGDGIIDSRWFELVNASSGVEVPLLGDSDRRYFAAVRVIDLSGLVNVNTATDSVAPPTLGNRAGRGPQDVSLFTLLTLDMHRQAVTNDDEDVNGYGGQDNEASYASFFTAINGNDDRNDYEGFDTEEQVRFGRRTYLRVRDSLLNWEPTDYDVRLANGEEDPNAVWTTNLSNYTPYAVDDEDSGDGPDRKRQDTALFGTSIPGFAGGGNARTGPFGVSDLIELLTHHGANDPEVFSALEQAFTLGEGDSGDPLYTRSLLRSDRTLEAEIGVELTAATGAALTEEELNRRARAQLDVRSLLTTISGSRPIRTVTTNAAGIVRLSEAQRRFRVDELMLGSQAYEAAASTDTDAIRRVQNAARNPLIRNGFEVYLRALAPHLDEFTDGTAWPSPTSILDEHARTLFYGHTGPEMALRMAAHMAVNMRDAADAPFVDLDDDGVPDPGIAQDLIDVTIPDEYAERRDEPSRALLWLVDEDERVEADQGRIAELVATEAGIIPLPANTFNDNTIAVLDADEVLGTEDNSVLAPVSRATVTDPSQAQSADAMIVYGVEAQPFLSEVFYFNAYWDAPRARVERDPGTGVWSATGAAGGNDPDSDYLLENREDGEYLIDPNLDPFNLVNSGDEAIRGVVNIDGHVDEMNRDFLFQVIVLQVFNPFDVPVSLEDFYFEFGGSIYRPEFRTATAADFELEPGATRLLYATNPGLDVSAPARARTNPIADFVDQRLAQADALNAGFNRPTFDNVPFRTVMRDVIDSIVPDDNRIPLQRYDVQGVNEITGFADLLAGDEADYGDDNLLNRTVSMWWDLGERFGPTGNEAWRRDDLLADRLVDTTVAGQSPVLDQRLRLDDSEFIQPTSVLPILGFRVSNAFIGAPINGAGPVAFAEGTATTRVNMNDDGERSVGLWARIRRFDSSADDAGVGGRRANDLPNPNGDLPDDPFDSAPVGSNPADGDRAVLGMPTGALPAAVFETSENRATTTQDVFPQGSAPFSPDELDFDRSFTVTRGPFTTVESFETALTIQEFFETKLLETDEFQENRLASIILPAFGVTAKDRYRTDNGTRAYVDYEDIRFINNGSDPESGVSTRTEPYAGRDLIQISLNSREFRTSIDGFPQLRVGDLLNVLAVGPYRMPLRTTGSVGSDGYPLDPDLRVSAYFEQWTTLGEALGVAEGVLTNLEDPASSNTDVFDQLAGVLDRGHLRLDDFVPYFDFDGDPTLPFDPAADRVRGLGIPAALNIFDIAQAGGELSEGAYGGIDQPIAGLVNINTAPPSVLRLLPGLYQHAPDELNTLWPAWAGRLDTGANSLAVGNSNVFFRGSASDGAASGSASDVFDTIDIASSILSYREPTAGYRRVMHTAQNFGLPGGADPTVPLNMGPVGALTDPEDFNTSDLTRGIEMVRDDNDFNDDGVPETDAPGIAGLRRAPGFGSIGELHAVRSTGEPTDVVDGLRFQFGMDWLARDRRTVSQVFIDPTTGDPLDASNYLDPATLEGFIFDDGNQIVSLDPTLLGDPLRFAEGADAEFQLPVTDQIPDDYDEQLIQINMLASSVSTSSDFYAAWMVIHGFEDDDVEGLDANEPMRPSFRTRYLMIVDRSNVVARGDAPRVLAFLEVPYGEEVREAVYTPE